MDVREKGISGVHFTNWSTTYLCTPELFFAPKTEDELKQILDLARVEKKKVKVVGSGHSPSDIACTTDFMISLQNFNKVLEVNQENCQVKVQAGITIKELNEIHLPKHGLALPVLGSVSDITVGGAISTGTHGTGIKYGIFSCYVAQLELMNSLGKIIKCSPEENEEIFLAAACGLGYIGIILTATLHCEPAFNLLQIQYATELKEVIEHLDIHLEGSEHFRFMWYPHTDGVVVSHCSRTDQPVVKKSWWREICDWILDYALGYYTLEFCYYISTFYPNIVPVINKYFYLLLFSRSKKQIDDSYKVFNFECLFKQYVNEWAIPKEKMGEVLWQFKEWIETTPQMYVHFPVEVRFTKADNFLISPASNRETCYINIIMYRPYNKSVPFNSYWAGYEKIMEEAGGRPHWAKAHGVTASKFKVMYPAFSRWCIIRTQLDPLDMFANSYLNRIFAF